MEPDLARLIVRHRHVAPMLSALLTGTNAGCRISDPDGVVIVEREGSGIGFDRFPINVEGRTVGWVEGDRTGRAIAAVLAYAIAREADKRSLAREALDRYRELNLVYELADKLSGHLDVEAVSRILVAEASRLPSGGVGFLLLAGSDDGSLQPAGADDARVIPSASMSAGIIGSVATSGVAEEVNDVAGDPRASAGEREVASLIVAPVASRGHALGVVGAASRTRIEYVAADLKLLAAIAAIAGPALAQARAGAAPGVSVG